MCKEVRWSALPGRGDGPADLNSHPHSVPDLGSISLSSPILVSNMRIMTVSHGLC